MTINCPAVQPLLVGVLLLEDSGSSGRLGNSFGGKQVLRAYGIDAVSERVVDSAAAARRALDGLRLPVVAKLRSEAPIPA